MSFLNDQITTLTEPTPKQTFIGIWFHDNNLSEDQQSKMRLHLNRTFYHYQIFVDMGKLSAYVNKERLVANIFFIISHHSLYSSLIELVQHRIELFEKIYIYLPLSTHTAATTPCFMTSNRSRLFERLSTDISNYNIKQNSSTIVTNNTSIEPDPASACYIYGTPSLESIPVKSSMRSTPIHHLTKEPLKFLYFLLITDIICQTPSTTKELSEMWIACRNLYLDNHVQLDYIDKLLSNYKKYEVAKYYTGNSCLSRVINQACHTENIRWIFTFRAYMSDLHRQLEMFHRSRSDNNILNHTLFRGKPLSGSVLQQIIDNNGGLMLMNGFLSTSIDRRVAFEYHGDEHISEGYRAVLFQFNVSGTIKQPYADISYFSTKPDESEVLFSLGIIWRIESVECNQNPCIIKLTSSNQHDLLRTRIAETYINTQIPLLKLGDILQELGDDIQAEWCYRKILEDKSLDSEICSQLHYKIGLIRFKKHDHPVALHNFELSASLATSSNHLLHKIGLSRYIHKHDNGVSLIAIHNNRGLLYAKNKRVTDAIMCYQQALCEKGRGEELAIVNNNLGLLYYENGRYIEAYHHHLKAIDLINNSHRLWPEFNRNFDRSNQHLTYLRTAQR